MGLVTLAVVLFMLAWWRNLEKAAEAAKEREREERRLDRLEREERERLEDTRNSHWLRTGEGNFEDIQANNGVINYFDSRNYNATYPLRMTNAQFDAFTLAFLETALWSSTDDDDEPLVRGYEIADIDPASLERLRADCERFQASPAWQAALEDVSGDMRADWRRAYDCSVEECAGHDFWLTRCGHGAGFWVRGWNLGYRGWKEPHSSALDKLSKLFGNVDLHIGDDGKIYASLD
jgi:hypothetical protein